jgi:hypothetical protein
LEPSFGLYLDVDCRLKIDNCDTYFRIILSADGLWIRPKPDSMGAFMASRVYGLNKVTIAACSGRAIDVAASVTPEAIGLSSVELAAINAVPGCVTPGWGSGGFHLRTTL